MSTKAELINGAAALGLDTLTLRMSKDEIERAIDAFDKPATHHGDSDDEAILQDVTSLNIEDAHLDAKNTFLDMIDSVHNIELAACGGQNDGRVYFFKSWLGDVLYSATRQKSYLTPRADQARAELAAMARRATASEIDQANLERKLDYARRFDAQRDFYDMLIVQGQAAYHRIVGERWVQPQAKNHSHNETRKTSTATAADVNAYLASVGIDLNGKDAKAAQAAEPILKTNGVESVLSEDDDLQMVEAS